MRIDQFNNLPPQNIIGSKTRSAGDEYNSSLKKERRPDPPEFSSSEVDEYISYSETMDLRSRLSANRSSYGNEMQNSGSKQSASRTTQSLTRSFVQQVVCMAAGAVIVTTTYNTMAEARNAERNSISESFAAVEETVETADEGIDMAQDEAIQNDSPVDNIYEYEDSGSDIDGGDSDGESGGSDGESSGNAGKSSAKSDNKSDKSSKTASKSNIKDEEETKEENSDSKNVKENKNAYTIENKTVEQTNNASAESSESGSTTDGESGQPKVILPEGHAFGTPISEQLADGSIKITYTCTECGKTYEIIISVDPEQ